MEAIIVASIAAAASITSAFVANQARRQVKPSNGESLARIIERIDGRLYDHVTDRDLHA